MRFFPAALFKVVVQRRHLEQATAFAVALFRVLEPGHLQHHGQGFHHEDAAHDGQHDFLAHDDGDGAQRAAQRQGAHITHEDLRGVGVEPQKGQPRPGHGRAEDQQLARARDVREEQVLGVHRAAGDVGKHAQGRAHHHHRHDGQAIEPVGEVDGIAGAHDDQVGQDDEAQHAQWVAHLFEEGQLQARLGRQIQRETRLHPAHKQLQHLGVGAFRNAERQVQGRHQPNDRLPEILLARAHAFGVFVDDLAPVVHPPNGTKAKRDNEHDPDKTVGQVKPQQGGDRNRQQNQHPAHGGRAAFGQVRLHAVAPNGLADLERGEHTDHLRARHQPDQQRRHRRHHGAEGEVLEDPEKAELGREPLQPLRKHQ